MGELRVRIDEAVEAEAEKVLADLGLTVDQSVGMLLRYVAQQKRLPFMPNAETVAAMEASLRGEGKSFDSIEALMADLNADD